MNQFLCYFFFYSFLSFFSQIMFYTVHGDQRYFFLQKNDFNIYFSYFI